MKLLLDLETVALDNAVDYVDLSAIAAPSNYKAQDKIDAYIAEAKQKALDGCALDPDLCRIVAVGMWRDGEDRPFVMLCHDAAQECLALETVWRWLGVDGVLIGYNAVGFDVPVLLRRSLYLGVDAPHLDVGKYRHPRIYDPQLILSFDGAMKYRSQAWYAKRLGYVEDGEDITGAQVGERIAAGDWETVSEHCRRDLHRLAFIAEKLKLWAVLPF